ncbi:MULTISPECIES: rhodanese-like domain-containing protein [Lentzea]|uniref:Rhodanese-related sulfurtransferase n=2 Tax=Lentzea TaxID=165301 RepID=A0A1W2DBY0_9PSEU|nr:MULTISPECIES: rhodanese-like domain-containing protein [Lentzea]MDX8140505.1 rhodanese-like domain-containing protein [Lentzea sp. BCCO 10_0061]SMC94975.1 Rhodanese-related sulfurtransferase [Lentzea albidocapillata]
MTTPPLHGATTPDEVDPAFAYQHVTARTAVLLDVREDDEYAAGHAPGAVHMPLSQLRDGAELPVDLRQRSVLAICRSGARSGVASRILAERGHTVFNVVGGMQVWQQAGLPVVDERGGNGMVA